MCVIKPTSEFSPLVKRQLQCTTVPWLWIIANRSTYLCKMSVLFINNFHLYSKAPVPLLQLVAGLPFLFLRAAFYLYKLCLTPLSYSLQYSLSLAIPFWAFQAFFICQSETRTIWPSFFPTSSVGSAYSRNPIKLAWQGSCCRQSWAVSTVLIDPFPNDKVILISILVRLQVKTVTRATNFFLRLLDSFLK